MYLQQYCNGNYNDGCIIDIVPTVITIYAWRDRCQKFLQVHFDQSQTNA